MKKQLESCFNIYQRGISVGCLETQHLADDANKRKSRNVDNLGEKVELHRFPTSPKWAAHKCFKKICSKSFVIVDGTQS